MGVFHFKKFSVFDDHAVMKVGTDSVLLGAWADVSNARRILDIGTGCGIIALIIAQRSDDDARIDVVESALPDANQALENFLKSPWQSKMAVHLSRIQEFNPATTYDLIVCNPPYFTNSLLPSEGSRSKVRHDLTLTWDELLEATARLLSPQGKFCCILPAPEGEGFVEKALSKGLLPFRITKFFTRRGKPMKRLLMEFRFEMNPCILETLILYEAGDQWTKEYAELTGEFYLDRPE